MRQCRLRNCGTVTPLGAAPHGRGRCREGLTDRRLHTTIGIRTAAQAEFCEIGPRALSLHKVAARAFVSVGAVYQRWPDKQECVIDLVTHDLPETVHALEELWRDGSQHLDLLVYRNLFDSAMVSHLRFMAECVFAARDDDTLRPLVRDSVSRFQRAVMARTRPTNRVGELGWWVASAWLGYALLKPSGCAVPDSYVAILASLVDEMGHMFAAPSTVAALTSDSVEFLPIRPIAKDETTEDLIRATQRLILEQGVDAADVRTIAATAGVTTGAIYRRFDGRSALLVSAFIANLPAQRYAWTQPLLAALQQDGLGGGAALLAKTCERIWLDETSANALLEFSIAAHADPTVQRAIFDEIEKVAATRVVLFEDLQRAGIVRGDLSAEALAWLLQVPPVGMRLLASIGITPKPRQLAELLEAYLNYLMAPEPGGPPSRVG